MPRFFIDLRDGEAMVKDRQGAIYSDIEDAVDDAKNIGRMVAKQLCTAGTPATVTCIEIRDVQGRTVICMTIGDILGIPATDPNNRSPASPGVFHR